MDLFLLVETLEVLAGGKKKEKETIVTGVSSAEKKKSFCTKLVWVLIYRHGWKAAVLSPEPLSWARGVKLCPVFSLKAQRRAVSKLLMPSLSSLCVVSAGDMIRMTTSHPLGTCGASSAPVLQPWLILCAAAAGSWTVLYCQKFSTRLRASALPFTDREGHVFSGKCMHAAVPGSMLSTQA